MRSLKALIFAAVLLCAGSAHATFQFTSSQNLTPATGCVAMYNLLNALISNCVWILEGYGDGTANESNAGGLTWGAGTISSGASGAHGLCNGTSWVRVREPSGTRELLVQRNSSNTSWAWHYSVGGLFTGTGNGALTFNVAPTATDVTRLVANADTNAAGQTIFGTDNTYRQQIGCDSAGTSSSGYGWFMVDYPTAGGEAKELWYMDPTTGNSDPDPYVFGFGSISNNLTHVTTNVGTTETSSSYMNRSDQAATSNGGYACGYLGSTSSSTNFVTLDASGIVAYAAGNHYIAAPGNLGTDVNTSNDNAFPLFWTRHGSNFGATSLTAPVGYKGLSSLFLWLSTVRGNNFDLVTITTTGDHLVINGSLLVPWNNTVPN